jgi:hypothetical protein
MGPFRVRIEKVGEVDPSSVPDSDSEDGKESESTEDEEEKEEEEEKGSLFAEANWNIDTTGDSSEQAMEVK